jgi:ABC-type lipoprotein export system ATPase subunit/GNAT superfamily N-acetyltransferase
MTRWSADLTGVAMARVREHGGCFPEGREARPGSGARGVRLTVELPRGAARPTPRMLEICLRFGVPLAGNGRVLVSDLSLSLRRGTVTLIGGPSGSGKTLLLREIARQCATSRLVGEEGFPIDVAVVDAVAPTRPVSEALGLLTACGLGEPALWARSFDSLSEGEQFRARLARAISLHRRWGGDGPILCDEFGAVLHSRLAKAVAFNLRKLASRENLALVVAASREDIEGDLRPDRVVRLGDGDPVAELPGMRTGTLSESDASSVVRKLSQSGGAGSSPAHALAGKPPVAPKPYEPTGIGSRPSLSFATQLHVERGTLADYEAFAAMHYRHRRQVGFVSSVFVLREQASGELLGAVVYCHPMLELALRNKATGGAYVRRGNLLNREMRVLKRLVVHPDVRGCGLGHRLVRETLPMAGARFVECLAAMGAVNPVFEKAGMRPVGMCSGSAGSVAALAWLRAVGADPLAADFSMQVRCRAAVRRVVAREVANWYRATTGGGEDRVRRQAATFLAQTYRQLAGSQPVYFIWAATDGDREFVEANLGGLQIAEPELQIADCGLQR